MTDTADVEDYLDAMRGLRSGAETEIDPRRAGDVQAFRDVATEQARRGAVILDPLNPDPGEANCTCGAPDVAHCDGCLACPGGAHDELCGW